MTSRRGHGEGSVYQRSRDGKWCAVVDLGWVDGRRRRKTRTADTRHGAVQALRELQGEVEAGALAIDRRDTVESLMRRYLQDEVRYRLRTGSLRQSTAESYERLARNHITPRLGHLRLSDLMPLAIQSAYDEMLREGLSPGTIQKLSLIHI